VLFVSLIFCRQCDQVRKAIDCCVSLNQWHQAIDLAKAHNVRDTSELLARYAQYLLEKEQRVAAIELYRKANHNLQAAQIIANVAEEEARKKTSPMAVKKLYVLAALLVQEHRKQLKSTLEGTVVGSRSSALLGLDEDDEEDPVTGRRLMTGGSTGTGGFSLPDSEMTSNLSLLENPWRGAEAYHLYLLAQNQLYEGYVDAAMRTSLVLRDYEGVIPAENVYCLLALSACANRAFATCSKAFIKLESLPDIEVSQSQVHEELAMDIFVKYVPKDSRMSRVQCPHCDHKLSEWSTSCPSCHSRFPVCMATGRPLLDSPSLHWTCSQCRHKAAEAEMTVRKSCPLCHAPVN
ncbi:unnamed protein product, partial [Cyprideis torosa]